MVRILYCIIATVRIQRTILEHMFGTDVIPQCYVEDYYIRADGNIYVSWKSHDLLCVCPRKV